MKHAVVSFEELIAPLSRGKVLVLVECLNIEGCEEPDIMQELSELLDLGRFFGLWISGNRRRTARRK